MVVRSILAASDLTDVSEEGLRTAAAISAATGAALHALHGTGAVGLSLREAMPRLTREAETGLRERLAERARAACRVHGARLTACHVSYHETLESLPATARAVAADLVVLGSAFLRRPTGVTSIGRLLRSVDCPVLIARPVGPPFRSVLVPLSGSDAEGGALRRALTWLAPLSDAGHPGPVRTDIHVLHVASGLRRWREAGAALGESLREADALLVGSGRLHEHVRWAEAPAGRILETATYEEADLIILGREQAAANGGGASTWETVVEGARCSVLLMPRAPVPPPSGGGAHRERPEELEPVLSH